jgi:hypothetical protein
MKMACFNSHYHNPRDLPVDLEARGVKTAAAGDRLETGAAADWQRVKVTAHACPRISSV